MTDLDKQVELLADHMRKRLAEWVDRQPPKTSYDFAELLPFLAKVALTEDPR